MKRIYSKDAAAIKQRLLERGDADCSAQQAAVDEILKNVRANGDSALFAYTKRFDGFDINEANIRVSEDEFAAAYDAADSAVVAVMQEAAQNIRAYHELQKRDDFTVEKPGIRISQVIMPVASAGVYVPGGKAYYPSSVLMNIIPAKVAGVENIVMATPAGRDGSVSPLTLIAAREAGADAVLKIGGAQAIAALAYGTKSVPRVDKITGPGNIYVALAKKAVYGQVGIDMIAGPSEVMVIADESSNPRFIAADFLSQAEHDALAACILVTESEAVADAVEAEIEVQAALLDRRDIVFKSLANYGTIIIAADRADCAAVCNLIAPEHLELAMDGYQDILALIKNAGSVFLGQYSPEPLGDYFAGANHVLPTNGTARFSSPLSVDDFIKKQSRLCYTEEAFKKVYKKVSLFAEAESLGAHSRSALIRFEEEK